MSADPGETQSKQDRADTAAKWVGIIGGLAAAVLALVQLQQGITQRAEELRWKRAELARQMVTQMVDDDGWQAMTMLDWEDRGREYEIAPGRTMRITDKDVYAALAPDDTVSDDRDVFIMDRFDRVFFLVSQMEASIRSGLVRREDVRHPLNWYTAQRICPRKAVFESYMRENAAPETLAFFRALEEWNACEAR